MQQVPVQALIQVQRPTTTQPSELWIGGITVGAAAAQSSATNGFTLLDGDTGTQISVAYLEKVVSATGAANSGTTIQATVG